MVPSTRIHDRNRVLTTDEAYFIIPFIGFHYHTHGDEGMVDLR